MYIIFIHSMYKIFIQCISMYFNVFQLYFNVFNFRLVSSIY